MGRITSTLAAVCPHWIRVWWWRISDPDFYARYEAQQSRIRAHRTVRQKSALAIWTQTQGAVAGGPFAGLKFPRPTAKYFFVQKMLGTYEKELALVIEEICAGNYDTVINLGSGEGYYACGMTVRMPTIRLKAFEIQETSRQFMRELSTLNGTAGRIDEYGMATVQTFSEVLRTAGRCVVICDVEGAERELLDPAAIPALLQADILVEVHDFEQKDLPDLLKSRFAATHRVERIPVISRTLQDLPPQVTLAADAAQICLEENRGESTHWLWIKR